MSADCSTSLARETYLGPLPILPLDLTDLSRYKLENLSNHRLVDVQYLSTGQMSAAVFLDHVVECEVHLSNTTCGEPLPVT
jgi:hypothetical protein